MPFVYSAINLFAWDITLVNPENVPKQGPTIIYGNHNNQFVDGMLLMNAVKRPMSFLAATKSMQRIFIGHLLTASGCIPVDRPQDIKPQKGPGTLINLENGKIQGKKTKFTKLNEGTILTIEGPIQLKITKIISDTEAEVQGEGNFDNANFTYKYLIKLEYRDLYEAVYTALNNGRCIGIYPQGGSHDRLQLLPLKAGICIMALGAMEKYNKPVKLVPCGFNYYNPQKFRSKAILQFGPAYEVPMQMVQLYRKDKKKAIAILLSNLEKMLKAVTTQFDSYDQLFALFMARQLYALSGKRQITIRQKLELNRRFSKGYMMIRGDPKYAEIYDKLLQFSRFVELTGIPVRRQDYYGSRFFDFFKFFMYLEKCILRSIIALPGIIMMAPTTSLIVHLAEKERLKCLKGSKVKKFGNDVVGSYKILLCTFLMPLTCAGHSVLLYFILQKFTKLNKKTILKLSLGLFALQPIYALLFVKSYDSFRRSWYRLKFLFMRLFKPNIYDDFNRNKREIQRQVLKIVQQKGAQVVQNFEQNRILKKDELHVSESQLYIFDEDDEKLEQQ